MQFHIIIFILSSHLFELNYKLFTNAGYYSHMHMKNRDMLSYKRLCFILAYG